MKRKPVTITEDQATLVRGAIRSEILSDRSTAVRNAVREYFTTHLAETASLVVTHEDLEIDAVAQALDVDRERLANYVATIEDQVAPGETTTYLEEIESEFEFGRGIAESSSDESQTDTDSQ